MLNQSTKPPSSAITVIGSLNMDLVLRTPRFPEAGETITGHDFRTIPGGKGANQAVAIARQEIQVHMVGHVGDDLFGKQILAACRAEQIGTDHLTAVPDTSTGVAIVVVEDSGENRIILAPGANAKLLPEEMDGISDLLASSKALVMQLEVPLPVVHRAARLAWTHGVPVILNAAPAQSLPAEMSTLVDYLVVNETEAALLTGCAPTEPREAAARLVAMGFNNVVITLGADGALLVSKGSVEELPGFRVNVVDTTAAGDAFVGVFAAALALGKDAREAVRRGNAAGALATTVLGAQPSLPSRLEIEAFLTAQQTRNHK